MPRKRSIAYDMRILKGPLLIFVFRIIGAALLFFTYSIVSSRGGVDELARFALLLSTFTIVGTFAKFGLDQLALREIQNEIGEQKSVVAFSALTISLFLAIISTTLVSFAFNDIALTLGVFAFSLYSIFPELYRANGSAFHYSILRNLGFNVILAILVFSVHYGIEILDLQYVVVCAAYISLLLSFCYLFFVYDINGVKHISLSRVFMLAKKSVPIALFQYMIVLHTFGYNLVLGVIGTTREIAIFSVFLQMILVFDMFSTSIGMYVGRNIAEAASRKDFEEMYKIYKTSCKASFIVLLPAFALLIILANWLLVNIFHLSVGRDIYAFYTMASAAFLSAITGPKFTVITMLRRESYILYAASGLMIILIWFLIFHNFFADKLMLVSLLYASFSLGLSLSMAIYALSLTRKYHLPSKH